jgi:hypothetical protein
MGGAGCRKLARIVILDLNSGKETGAVPIETATGARAGLFSPALNQFYLAVPRRGSRRAEIGVYSIE